MDFDAMLAGLSKGGIDWGNPQQVAPLTTADFAPSDISGPANANMQGLNATPPQMGGKLDYKSILSGIAGLGGAAGGGGQDQDLPLQTMQPSQQFGRIGAGASPMASPAWPYGR